MIDRQYWQKKIEDAWSTRPIVWLSGVRRVGKTYLSRMLGDTVYLNCDLPSVSRQLEDPEAFFRSCREGARIVLDEVHRLEDPSRVLKIASDAYPQLHILATGSSTLAATRKFRDSLAGRKWTIYLPPVLWSECQGDFNIPDLDRRLLHGGLPEPLLSDRKPVEFFSEWMDSFFARDIAELFGVRDRTVFIALLKLIIMQSGGMADLTKLSKSAGLSRPTVKNYIEAMAVAHAVFTVPPFHGGGSREIVRSPRLYAFDTGFVTFMRGWET
ncbi:MAG: AAA family ATPase, partial [Myxococcota bacterium]